MTDPDVCQALDSFLPERGMSRSNSPTTFALT